MSLKYTKLVLNHTGWVTGFIVPRFHSEVITLVPHKRPLLFLNVTGFFKASFKGKVLLQVLNPPPLKKNREKVELNTSINKWQKEKYMSNGDKFHLPSFLNMWCCVFFLKLQRQSCNELEHYRHWFTFTIPTNLVSVLPTFRLQSFRLSYYKY